MSIYIGIDGGGTKTAAGIEIDGRTYTKKINTPANPTDVGYEKSAENIINACLEVCADTNIKPESVSGIFAGIAGATLADYKDFLKSKILQRFINTQVDVSHDAENILYAAFPYTDGVAVICGTGSSCYVKKSSEMHRIGGYSTFDVLGSGYEIGKMVIAHALRCVDGRSERGVLCDLLEDKVGTGTVNALKELLELSKDGVAAFAPLVFEAYGKGDPAADKIIDINMAFIAEYIDTAARFFDGEYHVSITGGVGKNDIAFDKITSFVKNKAMINRLEADPVIGAIARAKIGCEGCHL